jgi:hypothetical protein
MQQLVRLSLSRRLGTVVAPIVVMVHKIQPVSAYVSAVNRPHADNYLATNGFCQGMVLFAMPDYGILFKCLAEGRPIDLEFGAFFALLRFVQTSLAGEKISELSVFSSNPEFVFAFTGKSRHLTEGTERERLLKEHLHKLAVDVSYIEPWRNQTHASPADYPSLPAGKKVLVKSKLTDLDSRSFKPIQKGIKV